MRGAPAPRGCDIHLSRWSPRRSFDEYKRLYDESVRDPTGFWDRMARENITWDMPYHTVMQVGPARWPLLSRSRDRCLNLSARFAQGGFEEGDIAWFAGGKMNLSVQVRGCMPLLGACGAAAALSGVAAPRSL